MDIYNFHHKIHLGRAWIKHEKDFPKHRLGLTKKDIKGKIVLEVGCGAGNYLQYYSKFKPKILYGIDSSVEAIKQCNIKFHKNFRIYPMRLNVFDLSKYFNRNYFDIIYSTGVLHHTGNTEKVFKSLIPFLKKGGIISICVYEKRNYDLTLSLWRKVTVKLPHQIVYVLSLALTPFSYLFKYIKPLAIFQYFIPVPIIEKDDFQYIWSCIFDDLTVEHLQTHTVPEVFKWFKDMGLKEIEILEPSVSIKGILLD
ncbi:hypothetical protein LCGC14_0577030 [marine sediment metagenome]|uniref:Methyltransferase type 11 domain-containing protein n=1 Tax=marine sediment metagenome TaxID=412755 RepID=A0A0F9U3S4_9ZZZZ|nr:class I SAM-dependent methyltransferase [bacterium]